MFIEENTLVKVTYCDNKTYTGNVYKTTIQLCEDDNNKPHALVLISQDKRYINQEGEYDCASLWVDKIKSLEVISKKDSL